MRIFLRKGFFLLSILIGFNLSAQCIISSTTDASSLGCGSGVLSSCGGIITIGNGVSPISLKMDADLDLTSCGVVQFIVDKAILDFSVANKRLYLAEGSSISFINGGTLNPPGGTGGGCTGNDRLYIGGVLLAACQGGAGILGFDEVISFGGTGKATSNSPVCPGNTINLTATAPPIGTYTYSWSGPGLAATAYSSSPNYSFTASTTPSSPVYTVSMKRTSDNKIITANTTVKIETPTITTQPTNQLDCEGASVKFKVVATGTSLNYTWQYKKPTDSSFTSIIGSVANTSNNSTNEITIGNVGSAQYPKGTQFQVIVSNGSCSVTSNVVTLSVNEILNINPISTNVKQCYGTNYSYTVTTSYPSNVVSYQWKKSVTTGVWTVLNDGGAYSGANTNTLTITGGTPAESAEYRVYITFNNSTTQCNVDSASRTRKITFLPQLTTPVTTITQPTCSNTLGTITVAVQSATDTYSFDGGLTYQASNVKSGLAVGTYDVIIKNEAGCTSSVTSCTIVSDTSYWNGSTWVNGMPDSTRKVVFQQNFNSTSDIVACSCQVTNGANVFINSYHTLKVTNEVNVASGSLTFDNTASLVQLNDAAINTGAINYKRFTTPVRRFDFTYWSSPVAGQTLKALSPNTFYDKYYGYNSNTGWVIYYNGSEIMKPGNGYSIRAPQSFSVNDPQVDADPVFVGVPNNGEIPLTIDANKLYLLGNPYPSAIDAYKFLEFNENVLEGTLYFWTHNTTPTVSGGAAKYNYNSSDYATYNRTGTVTTATQAATGGYVPSGMIAAGQGFFAPASTTGGNLKFKNSMRVAGGAYGVNNAQFFKVNTKDKQSLNHKETNRVWLNLTNTEGISKQTLIGYLEGATNGYDPGFDGQILPIHQEIEFYSVNQGKALAIQGRALPFVEKDSIALAYKTDYSGNFQISIHKTDGFLDTQDVFLEDNYLHITHNLKKTPYLFTTEKGVFDNRFELRYVEQNKVATISNQEVMVLVKNKQLRIKSSSDSIQKVIIYNSIGQILYQNNQVNLHDYVVENLNVAHQVIIVKVVLGNEQTQTVKIVF